MRFKLGDVVKLDTEYYEEYIRKFNRKEGKIVFIDGDYSKLEFDNNFLDSRIDFWFINVKLELSEIYLRNKKLNRVL